jgi:hypothetical protein
MTTQIQRTDNDHRCRCHGSWVWRQTAHYSGRSATDPAIDHNVRAFLKVLNSGGGKPLDGATQRVPCS